MLDRDNRIETLEKEIDTLRQQSETREVNIFVSWVEKRSFFFDRIN